MFTYNLYRLKYEFKVTNKAIHRLLINNGMMNNNMMSISDKLRIEYKKLYDYSVKRRLLVDYLTYCSIRSQLMAESQ